MNRRSLLKRAGLLGVGLPVSGMLISACGQSAPIAESRAATAEASRQPAGSAPLAAQVVNTEPLELTITARDISFDPTTLTVEAGRPVRLTFLNEGAIEHDWEVPTLTGADLTVVSQPATLSARMTDLLNNALAQGIPYAGGMGGEQMVIEFTPPAAGEFEMICAVPAHKEAGMRGTFSVSGEGGAAASDYHDPHVVTAPANAGGEPYEADFLPMPVVAPPVGNRGPELVTFEIETREVIGKLDEGVAYEFWTFDGTVPGTMLRVRVGDTVELTLKNAADSKATHNIDLHAVTGPGGGAKVTNVAPGQSASFRFKAMNPGVYVYHCAVAPIPHHISSGMYGLIVVEPEGGLPPVDREFYVMQGDLYLEGARGEKGLRPFSMDKMLDERPDYVVLNGAAGSIAGERAFKAEVGETVRIFFGVGGPNLVSSFHVIGEIFDRVMQEGATEWSTNVQTTLVPAGGATIVDFTCEVPGTLMIVDHSLGRLHKGAVGMIEVEGEENPDVFAVIEAPH
ncbi:MAG TPA: copper-containing nitrite reductase [Thermomicrobiales bacterium]|nr:copper-containing nitrite reductase [Thermomicrobiales bacterium]